MSISNMLKNSELDVQNNGSEQIFSGQKNLNSFFTKYYNYLIFLVAILVIVSGFFLLIQPKYKEINDRKKMADQGQLGLSYSEKQVELNKFIKLKRAYNKIDPKDKERIKTILPSNAEVEKLIAEIESIVLSNGLILSSLSIQPTEGGSKGEAIPVGVSLTVIGADYTSFKSLLKAIENNLRLMDIKNVSYIEGKGGLNLNLTTYYFQ